MTGFELVTKDMKAFERFVEKSGFRLEFFRYKPKGLCKDCEYMYEGMICTYPASKMMNENTFCRYSYNEVFIKWLRSEI